MKVKSYKVLEKQTFEIGEFSITPIRFEDRYEIMKWRNQQVYHLRQNKELTKIDQDIYFNSVVNSLFEQNFPPQLLFSFLKKNTCIGYGGLVHINWEEKYGEISFIMETSLEENNFEVYWTIFLQLIEKIAFNQLSLNKISTYAYDLRPQLYLVLEKNNYMKFKTIKDKYFHEGKFIDVIIHSKSYREYLRNN